MIRAFARAKVRGGLRARFFFGSRVPCGCRPREELNELPTLFEDFTKAVGELAGALAISPSSRSERAGRILYFEFWDARTGSEIEAYRRCGRGSRRF